MTRTANRTARDAKLDQRDDQAKSKKGISRIRRVRYHVAGPGDWLMRSQHALEAGQRAAKAGRPRKSSPFRHPGLREFWLAGHELGQRPEEEVKRQHLAGELPYLAFTVLDDGDPRKAAFLAGITAGQNGMDKCDAPQEAELREWWLGGLEHAHNPEAAIEHMRKEISSTGLDPTELIEEFMEEQMRLGARKQGE